MIITLQVPEFSDNSGQKDLEIFSTGSPGVYRVGRTWTITYTAKDSAGNTAKCEFSFKLSGTYIYSWSTTVQYQYEMDLLQTL